jgi:hypothetical protein
MSDAEAWMTKTSFPQMAGFNAPPDGRFWAPPDMAPKAQERSECNFALEGITF